MNILRELERAPNPFNILQIEYMTFTWFHFTSLIQTSSRCIGIVIFADDDVDRAIRSKRWVYWKGNSMNDFLKETGFENNRLKAEALRNYAIQNQDKFEDNILFTVMLPTFGLRQIWLPKEPAQFWPNDQIYRKYKSGYDAYATLE